VFCLYLAWNLLDHNDSEAYWAAGVALHSVVASYQCFVGTGCFLLQLEKSSSLYNESAGFSDGHLANYQSRRLHIPDDSILLSFFESHYFAMIFVRESCRIFDESNLRSNVFFAQIYVNQTLSYYLTYNHY
jgi:hypothetical protein